MESAIIATGKIGDILSAVAMAQRMEIPNLITSRRYGAVAEGLPGIKVHYLESEWDDLATAIRAAKQSFKAVLVPQTFGKDFPIQHTMPSFQLDQLARVNDIWGDLPRLKVNQSAVPKDQEKFKADILFVGKSQSSPFQHADALWEELNKRYGATHTLNRLDDIVMKDFKEFVPIYDAAKVLVTIDTAHLHLSSASSVPVIALATDTPHRWRGSADHGRFRFYCRYSDYPTRKEELFRAIELTLANTELPRIAHIARDDYRFAYNPSTLSIPNASGSRDNFCAFRHHPDPKAWRTQLFINDSKGVWPIEPPKGYESYSHEDPRLFMFGGKLYCSYVLSEYQTPNPPHCAVGYGELVFEQDRYTLRNNYFPQCGKNNWAGTEKNWLFFEQGGKLFTSYQCHPLHIVYQIQAEKIVTEWKTKCPEPAFGAPRGGTQPIVYNGMWLRFFHSQSVNIPQRGLWRYHIGAMLMDSQPPFQITALSKFPIITGSEAPYFPEHKFYKQNIVFPAGATQDKDGWAVSYGINDGICAMAFIKPEHLNL